MTNLFQGKVGEAYTKEQLNEIYKEADGRYANKIPPGYRDNAKPGNEKYGDYIIWQQLKEHAKTQGKPLIFVTDDKKDDWWWVHEGKTIGPRPEIRRDMYEYAKVKFYMYQSERFIEYARNLFNLNQQETQKAIDEVREVKEAQSNEAGFSSTMLRRLALRKAVSEQTAILLSQIEVDTLAFIKGEQPAPTGSVAVFDIKRELRNKGLTDLGISLAIDNLLKKDFIALHEEPGEFDSYWACRVTQKGTEWLLRNQHRFALYHQSNETHTGISGESGDLNEDDIPF